MLKEIIEIFKIKDISFIKMFRVDEKKQFKKYQKSFEW